jgi:hypothetical protein
MEFDLTPPPAPAPAPATEPEAEPIVYYYVNGNYQALDLGPSSASGTGSSEQAPLPPATGE